MTTTKPAPIFEHTTCSRCCGTGAYSFNLVHGSRCYGCGGTGYKLTKRGATAQAYLNALRSKQASEVKVGDLIEFDMLDFKTFARVTEATAEADGWQVRLVGIRAKTGTPMIFFCALNKPIRMGFTEQEKLAQRQQALAYQSTLTKAGTPSARSKNTKQEAA